MPEAKGPHSFEQYTEIKLSSEKIDQFMLSYGPGSSPTDREYTVSRKLFDLFSTEPKSDSADSELPQLVSVFDFLNGSLHESLAQMVSQPHDIEGKEERLDSLVGRVRDVWVDIVHDRLDEIKSDQFAAIDLLAGLYQADADDRESLRVDLLPELGPTEDDGVDIHYSMNMIIKEAGADLSKVPSDIADLLMFSLSEDINMLTEELRARR